MPHSTACVSANSRRRRLATALLIALGVCGATTVRAQDAGAAVVAQAEQERADRNPLAALARLEVALNSAPAQYDILWRAAREASDLGEAAGDPGARTEYYRKAAAFARRAVAAQPRGADGHFMLAVALGRSALSVGARERVKYATEIRAEALEALRITPGHAGALHVLAVWNAEVMRLSGMARFFARNFLGGAVFSQASWAAAQSNLEAAVAADPRRITHRVDLAAIYADTQQPAKARAMCTEVAQMPVAEYNDPTYKRTCAALLARLR